MATHRPTEAADDSPPGGVRLAPGVEVASTDIAWAFSRSGGPGGQNVNKVNTKAEMRVSLEAIPINPGARHRLGVLAGARLHDGHTLVIVAQSERSQQANKAECLERLRELVLRAMIVPKVRRATKPTRGSQQRRLQAKKSRGEVKRGRQQRGGHD